MSVIQPSRTVPRRKYSLTYLKRASISSLYSFWGVPSVGSRCFQKASMKMSLSRSLVRARKTSRSAGRMKVVVSLSHSWYLGGRSFSRTLAWAPRRPARAATRSAAPENDLSLSVILSLLGLSAALGDELVQPGPVLGRQRLVGQVLITQEIRQR